MIHNFSAGPAALPHVVLLQAQQELVDFRGRGLSLLEMSHRGPVYEAIHDETQALLRELLGIGNDTAVLFMASGARAQFAVVPMNLLEPGKKAGYVITGHWAEGALAEARKVGDTVVIATSGPAHDHIPENKVLPSDLSYLHITSNNTMYGTQWQETAWPHSGDVPLVCDMSSDILCRPRNMNQFDLVYAGAQKNLGPAGTTVVLIKKHLLGRSRSHLPDVFNYCTVAESNSLLNTPPVFAIYMMGLQLKWLKAQGGAEGIGAINQRKAKKLYAAIDNSGGFYKAHAQENSRSIMNVCFRTPSAELDTQFWKDAEKAGLVGLKGHRIVGGLRASIYNAVPEASVDALTAFMAEFSRS